MTRRQRSELTYLEKVCTGHWSVIWIPQFLVETPQAQGHLKEIARNNIHTTFFFCLAFYIFHH